MDRISNRDFVDVERELQHWQAAFQSGELPAINFRREVAPVIRLACDIYVRNPHGSRDAWLSDLQTRLALRDSARDHPGSETVAMACWARLSGSLPQQPVH